ncbi:MAG: hypothetical protein NTY04_03340 [Candidatus Staskawiczbacteria bacterium]|nr:hypothetical protein [Candidatus Staskawiczbacteria bacterium]
MKTKQKKDISRIVWPEQGLADGKMWQRNIGIVIMLCNMGKVIKWSKSHFPEMYEIEGVKVKFLPHLAFYEVGPVTIDTPSCAKDVSDAVKVVKEISIAEAKLNPKTAKLVEEMLTARAKLNRFGLGRFPQK